MLGLAQAEWKEVQGEEKQETADSKQRTLSDFIN
jgi:hypothetical protein